MYSNGLLPRESESHENLKGEKGDQGIGFKLTDDGNYNMQNKKITNLANPTNVQDSVNYMTMKAQTLLLDGSNHMTGQLNMNGKNIINSGDIIMNNKLVKQMGNPVGDQDAVNLLTLNNTKQELKTTIDNKINKNTDIDMTSHKIFGLENNPDHIIVKDVKSVVNKEYLNLKFLKKDKDGNYFDLKGQVKQ